MGFDPDAPGWGGNRSEKGVKAVSKEHREDTFIWQCLGTVAFPHAWRPFVKGMTGQKVKRTIPVPIAHRPLHPMRVSRSLAVAEGCQAQPAPPKVVLLGLHLRAIPGHPAASIGLPNPRALHHLHHRRGQRGLRSQKGDTAAGDATALTALILDEPRQSGAGTGFGVGDGDGAGSVLLRQRYRRVYSRRVQKSQPQSLASPCRSGDPDSALNANRP